ncbi:MAG: hypothetical protein M0027_19235 [Candidatus Dormibacteraeota bacterium]|nr:hypothetical protein [Candidatus Dormibacteraeota bacterium]
MPLRTDISGEVPYPVLERPANKGEIIQQVPPGRIPPSSDPGAQKVAILLPLAQGQIMAQLGEADVLVNRTLAMLALSVALLTAHGAYRLADSSLRWWFIPLGGLGLSAVLLFRALLPGEHPRAATSRTSAGPSSSATGASWGWPLLTWGNNRFDTGQPLDVLYDGIRPLSELEAYRYVLGTLQDAVSFNRNALRWQAQLLARGEVALVTAILVGATTLVITNWLA